MLSVAEALARVLSHFQPLETESVPCDSAVGRVLSDAMRATLNLPSFPNSSMDGYAVRAADVATAAATAPVTLAVIGDIPAGRLPVVQIRPGTAARIMTGAHIPEGADAVVPVEATQATSSDPLPDQIRIAQPAALGAYIRQVGEDTPAGAVVLPAGKVLRAVDMGVLAAFGLQTVPVTRRPRVAVLSTGDELVETHQIPGPGHIRDSNSHSLTALVRHYGGEPIRLGVARDQLEAVAAKLKMAVAAQADLILSSAGVSVGVYDVVRLAVEQAGALDFWKVRMRPGKPVAFGQYRGIPFLGLPGNPVSAIVGFELFARPAILKMAGRQQWRKPLLEVEVRDTLQSDGRESYLRARVTKDNGRYVAQSAGGQGSNILSALVNANAFVIIPEGMTQVDPGMLLKAWMIDWPEDVF